MPKLTAKVRCLFSRESLIKNFHVADIAGRVRKVFNLALSCMQDSYLATRSQCPRVSHSHLAPNLEINALASPYYLK